MDVPENENEELRQNDQIMPNVQADTLPTTWAMLEMGFTSLTIRIHLCVGGITRQPLGLISLPTQYPAQTNHHAGNDREHKAARLFLPRTRWGR